MAKGEVDNLEWSLIQHVICLIGALCAAVGFYGSVIAKSHRDLFSAYLEDKSVLTRILDRDPASGSRVIKNVPLNDRVLFRIMQLMNLPEIAAESEITKLDQNHPFRKILTATGIPTYVQGAPMPEFPIHIGNTPSLEIVAFFAQKLGFPNMNTISESDQCKLLAKLIAASLSDINLKPNESFLTLAVENKSAIVEAPIFLLKRKSSDEKLSDSQILAALYISTRVTDKFGPIVTLSRVTSNTLQAEDFKTYELLDGFLSGLINEIHQSPEVKESQTWEVNFWMGLEQFFMILCFFWMLFLLGFRRVNRIAQQSQAKRLREAAISDDTYVNAATASERALSLQKLTESLIEKGGRMLPAHLAAVAFKALKLYTPAEAKSSLIQESDFLSTELFNTRWILTWLSRAIPAIGFIGTVHGIANALMAADQMVLAKTPLGQSGAVAYITAMLGLAFFTTFIALLMGLVASLWNDHQLAKEIDLVNEVQDTLTSVIDPATR